MKIALKDFQDTAVEQLFKRLRQAKSGVREEDLPQAVVLSAPTGSGKTVITARLIEEILEGSDRFVAEPDAVFLWISDQPELNEQSRRRLMAATSKLGNSDLVLVDANFDHETFPGGRVYFLNTQKLGKDKLLTSKKGDNRSFTIWETIKNTAGKLKDRFYLIIDEAHRGMKFTRSDEANRKTIMQKFVLGSQGEIPPIDLILGVSATPQRFNELLATVRSNRGHHSYEVPPEQVRASGLLKDRIIVYYPERNADTHWTLLAAAARKWKEMRDAWKKYTDSQGLPSVTPVLVVQVENGNSEDATATNLNEVMAVLDKEIGLKHGQTRHCFDFDGTITANGLIIPKIDASQIQEETGVTVVLFKMALTTGWDCPRAEVMMSFRAAEDDTLIAQLIGRMVRTPLARRIEGNESLNTVALYLPRYNQESVRQVIGRLKTDPDAVPPTDVEEGAGTATLERAAGSDDAFAILTGLPIYRIEYVRKASNTRRLMRLARLLTTMHGIDPNAWDDAKQLIIETLDKEKARLAAESPDFDASITSSGEITIHAISVEQGTWQELPTAPMRVPLDDRNIDDLFDRAGQRLGEGLHLDYWQAHYDKDAPQRAKLELSLVLQYADAWSALENACGAAIHALFKKHHAAIRALLTSDQEKYNQIHATAKKPEAASFLPPTDIVITVPPNARHIPKHLYTDKSGQFLYAFDNTWEDAVIEAELARPDCIGWLRNFQRKPWALSVPYKIGGETRAMYPDFLVVRQENGQLVVDILEPHSSSLADSYAKARGLAEFAQSHSRDFGRIELIRKDGDTLRRLDLCDAKTQKQVLTVEGNPALDLIFGMIK